MCVVAHPYCHFSSSSPSPMVVSHPPINDDHDQSQGELGHHTLTHCFCQPLPLSHCQPIQDECGQFHGDEFGHRTVACRSREHLAILTYNFMDNDGVRCDEESNRGQVEAAPCVHQQKHMDHISKPMLDANCACIIHLTYNLSLIIYIFEGLGPTEYKNTSDGPRNIRKIIRKKRYSL